MQHVLVDFLLPIVQQKHTREMHRRDSRGVFGDSETGEMIPVINVVTLSTHSTYIGVRILNTPIVTLTMSCTNRIDSPDVNYNLIYLKCWISPFFFPIRDLE